MYHRKIIFTWKLREMKYNFVPVAIKFSNEDFTMTDTSWPGYKLCKFYFN